ncbi:MAG: thiamine phosphate synthase [Acidobacteria bacterium]|nr:thiamine phosphate synthase [Acidobacteriota bacterium]
MTPIVYCISEGIADDDNFARINPAIARLIGAASSCGITHFQVREKKLSAANLFDLAVHAVAAARAGGVKLLINGRVDIALAAGADGVHLPADGLPVAETRRVVPDGFLIGASTHTLDDAAAARSSGADLAVFGPVFASPGKGEGVGLSALGVVCAKLAPFPVVALGGIDESRVKEVLGAGAAGYAAIRYLNGCIRAVR